MATDLFGVEVGNQKADVVALNSLSPQNDEIFGSHHHKLHEFVAEDFFDFIGLFDGDGDS